MGKEFLNATKDQLSGRLHYQLRKHFPRGKHQVNKKEAAKEYARCYILYNLEHRDALGEDVEDKYDKVEESSEYQYLVESGSNYITAWNRPEALFPDERVDFLSYFFNCLNFDLFFSKLDDCVNYENKVLIECLELFEHNSHSNKSIYSDLAKDAINLFELFGPTQLDKNINILVKSTKEFFIKYIFPNTQLFCNENMSELFKSANIIPITKDDFIDPIDPFIYAVEDCSEVQHILNNVKKLNVIDAGYQVPKRYSVIGFEKKFYIMKQIKRFIISNIKRLRDYNVIQSDCRNDLFSRIENIAITHWRSLFKGCIYNLKVHQYEFLSEDNTEDDSSSFNEKCDYICNRHIFVPLSYMSLDNIQELIDGYSDPKNYYSFCTDIDDVIQDKKSVERNISWFSKDGCIMNVLPRLIREYYTFKNSIRMY